MKTSYSAGWFASLFFRKQEETNSAF